MSLAIGMFRRNAKTGAVEDFRVIDGTGGVAGVEVTRENLWGAEVMVRLGAEFLPLLATQDLIVEGDDLERFARECTMLLGKLDVLSENTPWDANYIGCRLRNFVEAAREGQRLGLGIKVL